MYTPGNVPCDAVISTFIFLSVATDDCNLCTGYTLGKNQNDHHMNISKGPYTALGPFILKCQEIKCCQVKCRVENMLLNTTRETGLNRNPHR